MLRKIHWLHHPKTLALAGFSLLLKTVMHGDISSGLFRYRAILSQRDVPTPQPNLKATNFSSSLPSLGCSVRR